MTRVVFTVHGRPEPGGSKRSVGPGKIIDANKKVGPWRDSVAAAAILAMQEPAVPLMLGPLGVSFTFYVRRPQAHYRTGAHSGELKPSAPQRPVTRPDVTKLVRAVEDACTSIVWRDDSQIVTQVCRKFYGEPERCEVIVQAMTFNQNGGSSA
jgi:crossover junction endodeoxyribonuclease RusA